MLQEQKQQQRVVSWENLPGLALSNIFARTPISDRSRTIPFVCTSWAQASRHPHCWSSFAHSSPDLAFLLDSPPYSLSFLDPFHGRRNAGLDRLRALIARAAGGQSITSLYFFPFLSPAGAPPNDDALLRLIAENCPNLKHVSFHRSSFVSQGAIFHLIRCCGSSLELIDFSHSPYFTPPVLAELGQWCPNIRGIRRNGYLEPSFAYNLTRQFPRLKMLNLSSSTLNDKDLLIILTHFKELTYLDVRDCQCLMYYMHIIKVASAKTTGSSSTILYD